jgi:hypothetical protein
MFVSSRKQACCSRTCIHGYVLATRSADFWTELANRNQAKMQAGRQAGHRARLLRLFPDVVPELAQLIYLRGYRAGWAQGSRERVKRAA